MNFGFVSTRFAGTDGVSLEAAKWAEVLWRDGHVSHCFPASVIDSRKSRWSFRRRILPTQRSNGSISKSGRPIPAAPEVSDRIREVTILLKETLYQFVEKFAIDILIPENALTIPMNVPLGLAITEFLAETGLPSISHHHDFYWERTRFSISGINDLLDCAFPPRIPNMVHTVINTPAQEQISRRKGVGALLIPNVFDFEEEPPQPDDYAADVRAELGLAEGRYLYLTTDPRSAAKRHRARDKISRYAQGSALQVSDFSRCWR